MRSFLPAEHQQPDSFRLHVLLGLHFSSWTGRKVCLPWRLPTCLPGMRVWERFYPYIRNMGSWNVPSWKQQEKFHEPYINNTALVMMPRILVYFINVLPCRVRKWYCFDSAQLYDQREENIDNCWLSPVFKTNRTETN